MPKTVLNYVKSGKDNSGPNRLCKTVKVIFFCPNRSLKSVRVGCIIEKFILTGSY